MSYALPMGRGTPSMSDVMPNEGDVHAGVDRRGAVGEMMIVIRVVDESDGCYGGRLDVIGIEKAHAGIEFLHVEPRTGIHAECCCTRCFPRSRPLIDPQAVIAVVLTGNGVVDYRRTRYPEWWPWHHRKMPKPATSAQSRCYKNHIIAVPNIMIPEPVP